MKEVLQDLDTIEIHTPDFDCDIDSCSDIPTVIDQNLPTGPETTLSTDIGSSEYKLLLLFSNRVVPEDILPISFQHYLPIHRLRPRF